MDPRKAMSIARQLGETAVTRHGISCTGDDAAGVFAVWLPESVGAIDSTASDPLSFDEVQAVSAEKATIVAPAIAHTARTRILDGARPFPARLRPWSAL